VGRKPRPTATGNAELALRRARPVSSLMRRHWISTTPSASVADVVQLMRLARVRQIPVESGGTLAGLVDHRRILASTLAQLRGDGAGTPLEAVCVDSVMDPQPPTAHPSEALGAAALRMHDAGIGCLPVVDGRGRLVGLVVESDLLRSAYGRGDRSTS
jgi:CBS domain-containing protein